ncbi:VOC family protein [Janibacter sp. CX7]|uniref:VOC family protein n=1 Tax=Janibacter sp. CX7 TaxID=2963431 RepID=UPI0020CB6B5B|nr:VOC family protein [Janibacter sp. CX7]UTT65846.1 VOC family protein [Janibacter sp. CX7]
MSTDVFGRVHLGYTVLETQRFTDWRRFGADAIGLHVDELTRETMRFRLDDHECRFLLQRGPAEDVTAVGWLVDDHETFDAILARVTAAGLPVEEGTDEECALRGVERLWRFPGPKGVATEIFTTPLRATAPLQMQISQFVTGDSGMGHLAITTKDAPALHRYYARVFDARLTDYIDETISGLTLKIRFLRVNERHHSIAVANLRGLPLDPVRTSIQHLNTQVATLDDLLASHGRVTDLGFRMVWDVGQHTNDRELSYYCQTPSGFEWEVGWNPVLITPEVEATWEPTTHQGISIWGHTPVGETVLTKLGQFRQAFASAREQEITVPELSGGAR